MENITTIVFDLGGVVFDIDKNNAIARFEEIGFDQAAQWLDAYEQKGIFGDVEAGRIDAEEFRAALCRLAGKDFTIEQCMYAWQGYYVGLPEGNLYAIMQLRRSGYRVCLLSNTNPFMMAWARSGAFDGKGNALQHYFDALYLSYEMKVMKPDARIFEMMLEAEGVKAENTIFIDDGPRNVAAAAALGMHTLQPEGAHDWRVPLWQVLNMQPND